MSLAKVRGWISRYGPAEVLGTIGAVLGAWLVHVLGGNAVLSAYGGVLGENVGFYGTMFVREYAGTGRGWRPALAAARTLAIELGPAELLDSTIVRPLAMGLGMAALGPAAGAMVGKVVADVVFYIPVIVAYELRTRARR